MKFELIDPRIKRPDNADYPYIEHHLSHEDSLYGFYILVRAQSVIAAAITTNIILGIDTQSLSPATEVAGNTFYDVNAGAAAKRHLGNLTFDFSAKTTNILYVKPGGTIGAITFPNPLPPFFGLRFVNVDLRLVKVIVSNRLGN